jgi:hypothetical protein
MSVRANNIMDAVVGGKLKKQAKKWPALNDMKKQGWLSKRDPNAVLVLN